MAEPVDITRGLQLREYYRRPALAVADFYLGKIDVQQVAPFYGLASGRDAFLTWADAQGWSDAEWVGALLNLSLTGLNRSPRPSGDGR